MPESAATTTRPRDNFVCICVFVAALLASLWFTHAGWNKKLLDTHAFRQTQTALSAYWMAHEGIKMDYPTPVMGAPWSIPMEFPVYQACVVLLSRTAGLPLESAGRAVSLIFFYLTLPAVWLLLRRLAITAPQRWLFLALVLTSPIYIFYSRTFLIESTALCLGMWFLYFFHAALDERRLVAVALAAVFGIATGLAKVTTFAVVLVPALVFGLRALRLHAGPWRGLLTRGFTAALPGVLAATWWVIHTDAVKRQNVFGVSMTSTEQRDWNYGPLLLRFEPNFWHQFGVQLERAVIPLGSVVVFAIVALLFVRGTWRTVALLLAIALAGPLVFANLYFVHDYYLYSSGIFFLAVFAWPLKRLVDQPQWPFAARVGIVLVALATQFTGYLKTYYQPQITAEAEAPEFARALGQVLKPDDVFVGFGMNWNSVIPYYSERRAMMVPDKFAHDDAAIARALANLGNARIAGVLLFRPGQPPPEFFTPWLKKLNMDENPFLQTGEYSLHIRKDLLPEALKALAGFPLKQTVLYQGLLGKQGEKPPLIFYADQVADKSVFSMMHPAPIKVVVPFGLGAEPMNGRLTFAAHTPTEIEIAPPAGAQHIEAEFGMNPGAYDKSDGVDFEVVLVQPGGGRQTLFRRSLQPAVLSGDRGFQTLSLDTATPLAGKLLFRTLPGGNPNFDWAFWSRIDVR